MASPRRTSLLCPGCRRLVSADEPACPHCGLKRPGAPWRAALGVFGPASRQLVPGLIAINITLYLLSLLLTPAGIGLAPSPFSFLSPDGRALYRLGATGVLPIAYEGRWWTLITASFLHGGLLHLFFNMAALWQLGPFVQQIFGTHRFVVLYVASGAAGFLLSYFAGIPFTIGASASLCGLIGAILYYGKSRGGFLGESVYRQATGWIVGLVLFGLLVPGINNWAHGGGLAAGLLAAFALGYEERNGEPAWLAPFGGVTAIGTLVVLVWATVRAFLPDVPAPF
ncbi:MAG TPA: rhomboid family intramembrane serine protease [Syntrophales bacterium]|nr:rhomboid family intramembrane serine protease [Syntrophales bacterium]